MPITAIGVTGFLLTAAHLFSPVLLFRFKETAWDSKSDWERGSSTDRPTLPPGIEAKTPMLKSSAA
jgi:hypothetical protein